MRGRIILAAVVLGAIGLSCDSGPKAGELVFNFESPDNNDRAIVFKATAATPFMITNMSAACSGCQIFPHKVTDQDWRGVLTGVTANTPALRVAVSDRKEIEAYSLTVTDVAGADYQPRATTNRRLVLVQ